MWRHNIIGAFLYGAAVQIAHKVNAGAISSQQFLHSGTVQEQFLGDIEQTPPMVSAVKVSGKRLYKLARKGIKIKREPRKIRISSLRLVSFSLPEVRFHLECSKGTYVRKLAEDVGKVLGCGGCISQIKRTRVGDFSIEDAVRLEDIDESHIRRWQD